MSKTNSETRYIQVKLNLSERDLERLVALQEREGLARPAHAAILAIERASDGIEYEGLASILTRIDKQTDESLRLLRALASSQK